MNNLRIKRRPKNRHGDFELVRGNPCLEAYNLEKKQDRKIATRIRQGDFDFAICYWGNVGRIVEVGALDSPSYYLVRDNSEDQRVREIFENIDWKAKVVLNIGAAQIQPDEIIELYDKYRKEHC
jgi:hypothetical protein